MAWMIPSQAAAALGCSERTIRRRIDDGSLATRRHQGKIEVSVQAADKAADQQLADVAAGLAIQAQQYGQRFDAVLDKMAGAATEDRRAARNARLGASAAVLTLAIVSAGAAIGYIALEKRINSARLAATTAQTAATVARATADGLAGQVRSLDRVNRVLGDQVARSDQAAADARNDSERLRGQLERSQSANVRAVAGAVADLVGRVRGVLDGLADWRGLGEPVAVVP